MKFWTNMLEITWNSDSFDTVFIKPECIHLICTKKGRNYYYAHYSHILEIEILLVVLDSSINFFIYFFLAKFFRKAIVKLIRRCNFTSPGHIQLKDLKYVQYEINQIFVK